MPRLRLQHNHKDTSVVFVGEDVSRIVEVAADSFRRRTSMVIFLSNKIPDGRDDFHHKHRQQDTDWSDSDPVLHGMYVLRSSQCCQRQLSLFQLQQHVIKLPYVQL